MQRCSCEACTLIRVKGIKSAYCRTSLTHSFVNCNENVGKSRLYSQREFECARKSLKKELKSWELRISEDAREGRDRYPRRQIPLPSQHLNHNTHVLSKLDEVDRLWSEILARRFVVDKDMDPFYATSSDDFDDRLTKLKRKRNNVRNDTEWFNPHSFRSYSYKRQMELLHMYHFERKNDDVNFRRCTVCRTDRLVLEGTDRIHHSQMCNECYLNGYTHEMLLERCQLPIWRDEDGRIHYEVPSELQDLTFGEQLLIQRMSPLIPVKHIRKGTLGILGHCCCYIQHNQELCNSLPRCKSEVVKFVKKFKSRHQTDNIESMEDDGIPTHASFLVRRDKVLTALLWLKKHHSEYRNEEVLINEHNLDWMDGQESCDLASTIETDIDSSDVSETYGSVSTSQTKPMGADRDIEVYGSSTQAKSDKVPATEIKKLNELKEECRRNHVNIPEFDFPLVSEQPINEYHTQKIFSNVYPWLFPGGEGDIFDDYDGSALDNGRGWIWANRMINWYDGRFMKDKTWCFYALDMIQRHESNSNGKFFVKGMLHEDIQTLDDLKQKIREKSTSFISKIQNFSSRIKGSDPYWRAKKPELENWIEHHIQLDHGPPNLFITLSCAENWWPDLKRLLIDKVKDINPSLSEKLSQDDQDARCQAIRDYSGIVQQYFYRRVENWLETVGKHVFGIEHYWCRFEFAKGRGEVHAHMVAITCDGRLVNSKLYEHRDDEAVQSEILAKYAKDTFGMTATFPGDMSEIARPEGSAPVSSFNSCLKRKLSDVDNSHGISMQSDLCQLCNMCQIHKCSNYCMHHKRKYRRSDKSHRYCSKGCGDEATPNKFDTPGFEWMEQDSIIQKQDGRFKYLALQRQNSRRFVQTSTTALQSWRANCDIKILVYDHDPFSVSPGDIANVTDYIISYTTKANQTLKEEYDSIRNLIMCSKQNLMCEDQDDVVYISRKIMNSYSGKRMISKQEASFLLNSSLSLTMSSDIIQNTSISGYFRILSQEESTGGKGGSDNFLKTYAQRSSEFDHMSLCSYFHYRKNLDKDTPVNKRSAKKQMRRKTIIPHFTGMNGKATYPPTVEYAKATMIAHKPWSKRQPLLFTTDDNIIKTFVRWVHSPQSPRRVKIKYAREKLRFNLNIHYSQIKPKDQENPSKTSLQEDDELVQHYNRLSETVTSTHSLHGLDVDIGVKYDWSSHRYEFDNCSSVEDDSHLWLEEQIKHSDSDLTSERRKDDGDRYHVRDVKDFEQQQRVVYLVLSKLREWVEFPQKKAKNRRLQFKPLHLTVMGEGGTGKSFVIHLLDAVVSRLFNNGNATMLGAPTGAAAFNIFSSTIHALLGIKPNSKKFDLTSRNKEKILKRYRRAVMMILDERSMISQELLGMVDKYLSEAFTPNDESAVFGNLPVVIVLGDDGQLPSVVKNGRGKGAPYVEDTSLNVLPKKGDELALIEARGALRFKDLAKNVIELQHNHRSGDCADLRDILQHLRNDTVTEQHVHKLQSLHLSKQSPSDKARIINDATYIYANRDNAKNHNYTSIHALNSSSNPLAMIKCHTLTTPSKCSSGTMSRHFSEASFPKQSLLCRGAKVAISGKNFKAKWGLFNGSVGKVIHIHFKEYKNPNVGHHPEFVVVDFPLYCGPIWNSDHPTHVPLPPTSLICPYECCKATYIPLELAFARTLHQFQGQEAGLTKRFKCIVCDPGSRKFEELNPGTAYTAVSRASHLDDDDGRNSAIYFIGPHISHTRFRGMTQKASVRQNKKPKPSNNDNDSTEASSLKKDNSYKKVIMRKKWVKRLRRNISNLIVTEEAMNDLSTWVDNTSLSTAQLDAILQFHGRYMSDCKKTMKNKLKKKCSAKRKA